MKTLNAGGGGGLAPLAHKPSAPPDWTVWPKRSVAAAKGAPPRARRALVVRAEERQPRRLLPYVLSLPAQVEGYFENPQAPWVGLLRKVLWAGISLGAGFFSGNVVSLSFGALAVNDILAGVVTLVFYEAVSQAFYTADRITLRLLFLNCFKMGVTAALVADAVKLGS